MSYGILEGQVVLKCPISGLSPGPLSFGKDKGGLVSSHFSEGQWDLNVPTNPQGVVRKQTEELLLLLSDHTLIAGGPLDKPRWTWKTMRHSRSVVPIITSTMGVLDVLM